MTDAPKFGFLCVGKNPLDLSVSVHACDKLAKLLRLAGFMPGGCYTEIVDAGDIQLSMTRASRTIEHLCLSNELVMTIGNTGFSENDIIPDVTELICTKKASYFTNILCGSCNLPFANNDGFSNIISAERIRVYPDSVPNKSAKYQQISNPHNSGTFSERIGSALTYLSEKLKQPCDKTNLDSPIYSCSAVSKNKANSDYSSDLQGKITTLRLHPSRACAGIFKQTLILNLPSEEKSACDTISAVISALWVCVYNISGKSASLAFNYEKTLKSLPEFQEIINKKDIVNT